MVILFENTKDQYSMDGYLHKNLTTAKIVVKKDWDMLFVVDGIEGGGKSVLAQQMAKYFDYDFNIDKVVFTPTNFEEVVKAANKYSCIVYDEAFAGLSSRAAMSKVNKSLVKMLTEIRQKNLFIIIVLPTFFDLDKYVALWRSRALIHIYKGRGFKRGFFSFYSYDKKKQLYVNGKKYYNYSKPSPNFVGRFRNHYTVDKDEYKKKKYIETTKEEKTITINAKRLISGRDEEIAINLYKEGISKVKIRRVLERSETTIYNWLRPKVIME
jgi:hypothetical protein